MHGNAAEANLSNESASFVSGTSSVDRNIIKKNNGDQSKSHGHTTLVIRRERVRLRAISSSLPGDTGQSLFLKYVHLRLPQRKLSLTIMNYQGDHLLPYKNPFQLRNRILLI